jgi:U3 small nucleolar RNA-associated protein 4
LLCIQSNRRIQIDEFKSTNSNRTNSLTSPSPLSLSPSSQRTAVFESAESGASSLAFVNESRLVVGCLAGQLVECDLLGRVLSRTDSYGGAVWAVAACPLNNDNAGSDVLAVACEDGCVRLFKRAAALGSAPPQLASDMAVDAAAPQQQQQQPLVLFKTLAKQKARITALAWHCRGEILVSGDAASGINVWAPNRSVNPKVHIDVPRRGSEAAVVWSVAMLRDTTVVSGDSFGHTTMWNARFGTPLHRATEHAADVLAVAVSNDDRFVFASGIDAKVVIFQRTNSGGGGAAAAASGGAAGGAASALSLPWTVVASERRHTHDVRALAVSGGTALPELLVSASVDCSVNVFAVAALPRRSSPYALTLTRADTRVSLAPAARAIVANHGNSVSLWALGDTAAAADGDDVRSGSQLMLGQSVRCLASVRLRGDALVLCSAASSDLSTLAVSTRDSTRLFAVEHMAAGAAVRVRRVRNVALPGATHLSFAGDKLVLATRAGDIAVCAAADGADFAVVCAAADDAAAATAARIVALCVAPFDAQLIAYASSDGAVRLVRLDAGEIAELPRGAALAVSVAFAEHERQLLVTYADTTFLVWDVDARKLTDWSRQHGEHLPHKLTKMRQLLRGAIFNPAEPSDETQAAFLWSDDWLMSLDLSRAPPAQVPKDAINKFKEPAGFRRSFWFIDKFKPVVHAGFVAANELVVVELPAATTLAQLPKALFRARFGV